MLNKVKQQRQTSGLKINLAPRCFCCTCHCVWGFPHPRITEATFEVTNFNAVQRFASQAAPCTIMDISVILDGT